MNKKCLSVEGGTNTSSTNKVLTTAPPTSALTGVPNSAWTREIQREHGSECGAQPAAVEVHTERVAGSVRHALCAEQVAQPVVETVDQQDQGESEGADDLDVHTELRDATHDHSAGDVEDGLDHEEE